MKRDFDDDDDWDSPDDDIDNEIDDEAGSDAEDDETIPCPYCGRSIHEEAERCPYCGRYLSDIDAPPPRRPLWIAVGVLVCLVIVQFWSFPSLFLKFFGL